MWLFALCSLWWGCSGPPAGLPDLATRTAESYLKAWQAGDYERIYRLEDRGPESRSVLHRSLTDRLLFYQINEVRYSDSAAACVVTLRWQSPSGTHSETGELYLHRRGTDWQVAGYRNY